MLNFDWYRSFVAVYQIGTVSGAAEARSLTQPAITQHLAALEAAVGEPLFQRTPRKMLPTERGKELYTQIVQALEKLEKVSQQLKLTSSPESPILRLAAPREYFYEQIMAKLLPLPVRWRTHFGLAPALLKELEQGETDLVIACQRLPSDQLIYLKLDEEDFWLIGPPDFKMPDFGTVEPSRELEDFLKNQFWLSYGIELPVIRRFWHICFGHHPDFEASLILPDLHALLKAVQMGVGITLSPDYLVRSAVEAGLVKRIWRSPKPILNEIWLAYRKVDRNRPELAPVLEALAG